MTKTENKAENDVKTLAIDAADLAALGEGQVAYVRPM